MTATAFEIEVAAPVRRIGPVIREVAVRATRVAGPAMQHPGIQFSRPPISTVPHEQTVFCGHCASVMTIESLGANFFQACCSTCGTCGPRRNNRASAIASASILFS